MYGGGRTGSAYDFWPHENQPSPSSGDAAYDVIYSIRHKVGRSMYCIMVKQPLRLLY